VDRNPHEPGRQYAHPAIHRMCQKPATTPTKADSCAATCVTATTTDLARRRRKASCRLTSVRAASNGIATEKATTQILADASSDAAVRNGCTMTTPTAINAPKPRLFCRSHSCSCSRSCFTVTSSQQGSQGILPW
jgi:hypothetical protein